MTGRRTRADGCVSKQLECMEVAACEKFVLCFEESVIIIIIIIIIIVSWLCVLFLVCVCVCVCVILVQYCRFFFVIGHLTVETARK